MPNNSLREIFAVCFNFETSVAVFQNTLQVLIFKEFRSTFPCTQKDLRTKKSNDSKGVFLIFSIVRVSTEFPRVSRDFSRGVKLPHLYFDSLLFSIFFFCTPSFPPVFPLVRVSPSPLVCLRRAKFFPVVFNCFPRWISRASSRKYVRPGLSQ